MNFPLTGAMLIGATSVRGGEGTQRAFNPTIGRDIPEPVFGMGGDADVDRAARLADEAFDGYRDLPLERRAALLEAIAVNLLALGDSLIERAQTETGLPAGRLQGERTRTINQLRLFAEVAREGRFLGARIDPALPDRQPVARPDLRLVKVPLGPVAVFGASNFPLAFSVAGGDTVSALAAGAPVIVKAHNAHLGTSELVGRAIQQAVSDQGLHEGVFSLLMGRGKTIGESLVQHPLVKAVGFTGSRQGGLALLRLAQARPEPIPMYAEMSSINPVFLLPQALSLRAEALGRAFVDSLTLGAGQFCTNPGLVVAIDGPGLDVFIDSARKAMASRTAQTMLTPGIHAAYLEGTRRVGSVPSVSRAAEGLKDSQNPCSAQAMLFCTDAHGVLTNAALSDEVFGPASIVIRAKDLDEMLQVARHLEGQLTATLQLEPQDEPAARRLLPILERKSGRILANGFPTGVEVSHAMVHGGPFPSTTNAMFTSVGATAIDRFLRPVCYQDLPDALLPAVLGQANPMGVPRLLEGKPE